MTKLKTNNIDTDTIDLVAIEKEDPALGRVLRLILDLPRPWLCDAADYLHGFVKARVEPRVRQAAIDKHLCEERLAKEKAHAEKLAPALDELARHVDTIKSTDEIHLLPSDVKLLSQLAGRAEIGFARALAMAGLSESSPAVEVFVRIRDREQATV